MAISMPYQELLGTATRVSNDIGIEFDRTDDGATKAREVYPATYIEMELDWPLLTRDQVSTLRNFLNTNRALEIEFIFGGLTYHGRAIGGLREEFVSALWRSCSLPVRVQEV